MIKFSSIVENLNNIKYFKISYRVNIIVQAFNEGEAKYVADSTIASTKGQIDYNIDNVKESTKNEYDSLVESYGIGFEKEDLLSDISDEDKILKAWDAEFGNRTPTATEKMEFYHNMRLLGLMAKFSKKEN
jgi:hypothetical protein